MRWHPIFDVGDEELARCRELTPDQGMAEAAAKRDGVLDHRQLRALGFSPPAIQRRVDRRAIFRLHRGVYAIGRTALTPRGEARAALLRCGRGAVLSHHSAAWLQDVLEGRGRVDVTTNAHLRRPHRRSRIELHYTEAWLDGDVVWIGDFPCTSLPRTLIDLAAVDARAFRRAWNDADQRTMIHTPTLQAEIARGRAGAVLLEKRLDTREEAPPLESVLEEMFYDLCERHGIRAPSCQWPLEAEDRSGRVDFVFFPERVAVEVDGRKWHAIQEAYLHDRAKDLALRDAGYDPHRYGYREVRDVEETVARVVVRALAERQVRR